MCGEDVEGRVGRNDTAIKLTMMVIVGTATAMMVMMMLAMMAMMMTATTMTMLLMKTITMFTACTQGYSMRGQNFCSTCVVQSNHVVVAKSTFSTASMYTRQ